MASASTLTSVAYIYKTKYKPGAVGEMAMREHPFFAMMPKKDGFGGANMVYAIRYGNPQGVSGSFADAQAGASSSKGIQMTMYRRLKYGVITLDGESLSAALGNDSSFLDLVTQETDGIIEEQGDSLAFDLYRDGTGVRGRRASISTDIVTLTLEDDARNFKVGMTVIASPNADGSSPRVGSTTVDSVDEDGGTVTLTSAAAITAFADNDYLFRKGDPGTCIEGLAVHIPLIAPTAGDNFRGQDRSKDVKRLSGARLLDPTGQIVEDVGTLAVKISQIGKRANAGFVNPVPFWQASRALGAKQEYEDVEIGGGAVVAFEKITINTPAGNVKLYSDPDCPPNRGYVVRLNERVWCLHHLKAYPHLINDDGNYSLRQGGDDGVEARSRSMGNLALYEPGSNGVFSIG